MTHPTESEISHALAGHFYQVTRDGTILDCMAPILPHAIRSSRYTGKRASWSTEEHATLIRLYRAGTTWVELTKTMARNHKLIRLKVRELIEQGVLEPRRTGRRPKA